jgi:hypothetical protein
VQITLEECKRIIVTEGGLETMTVFGCYTYLKGDARADGRVANENDIYTEWGRRDDNNPLIAIHTQGDVTSYFKFEHSDS